VTASTDPPVGQPAPLTIRHSQGGGGGPQYDICYRVNQLPPNGPLRLVVEWLSAGITETSISLDGGAIRHAGGHASQLWPGEQPR
jgi:hypothetical protein